MKNELVKIEEPKLPSKWSYEASIKKVKVLVYKWKNLTTEVIQELWIAREVLSKPGSHESTWGEYCGEIGIEQNTANGWLRKYFLPVINHKEAPKLPEGKFNVIYADPPWAYDVDLSSGATRSPTNNYPVMDLEKLKEFGKKIQEVADKNCILFMWITAPKFNWMTDVLEAWGFEYKTNFIWDKIKPNMGHYSSVRHEILIIAGKGTCAPICDGKTIQSIDSVQSIEKSPRHSEKPEKFYEIIETLYPKRKYLELFHRGICRKNWTCWGNETNGNL